MLTAIIHFSGGVDNPIHYFFIFHVLLAGIILGGKESLFYATLAVFLYGGLITLEHLGVIPHCSLVGVAFRELHLDYFYMLSEFFIFCVTVYTSSAMVSYLSSRLHRQQKKLEELTNTLSQRNSELKSAHDLIKQITDGIEEGIMLLDVNHKVIWANRKVKEIYGEIVGDYCYRAVHHTDAPPSDICPISEIIKTGRPSAIKTIPVDWRGNKLFMEIGIYPIKNEEGESVQFIHVSRDITERMRAQEELKTAYSELKLSQSQLVQSEKMATIGRLAAGIAHEINNPTAFVLSNLSTLGKYISNISSILAKYSQLESLIARSDNPSITGFHQELMLLKQDLELNYILEDLPKLISETSEGATRIKAIVQDLKTFSRIEESEKSYLDPNEVIDSVLRIFWNELKFKTDIVKEYGPLSRIDCYPQQLSQVFLNLLTNALDAIKEHGTINIKTYEKGQDTFIEISDTGSGMSEDTLSHLFEPFFTTKPVGKGTGLGLSIVYSIIKNHKGDIQVESKLGEGTRFIIRLPRGGG
jgi:two-component system NtrC family sensor kinase